MSNTQLQNYYTHDYEYFDLRMDYSICEFLLDEDPDLGGGLNLLVVLMF